MFLDKNVVRGVVLVGSSLLGMGCEATVGPYVADITQLPNGDLVVVRCTTTVTRVGNLDSYSTGDCKEKVLRRYPEAASSQPSSSGAARGASDVPTGNRGVLVQ